MKCDSPYYVSQPFREPAPVPCGRCPPCKKRRVDSWVFRLMQEHKRSTSAHFVTLTYNTENVPISANGFMTLSTNDPQLFFKRLRKNDNKNTRIKYYLAAEYGEQRKRPHYHAIIFNLDDIRSIEKSWTLGDSHIGTVTQDSVAYCMKYIDKFTDKKRLHPRDDREPEFSRMSKGLGENYLTPEIREYHKAEQGRLYVTNLGNHKVAMPKYYRDKIFTDSEKKEQINHIRQQVEIQELKERLEFDNTNKISGYTYEQYVQHQKVGRYHSFYHKLKKRD